MWTPYPGRAPDHPEQTIKHDVSLRKSAILPCSQLYNVSLFRFPCTCNKRKKDSEKIPLWFDLRCSSSWSLYNLYYKCLTLINLIITSIRAVSVSKT